MGEVDDFIAHYGKKGMRWGHRKNPDDGGGSGGSGGSSGGGSGGSGGSGDASGGKPKKLSRKEARALNKKGELEFNQKKMEKIFEESFKGGDEVLIATRLSGDNAITITTGKEIVAHLSAGGALDVRTTEVFARLDKDRQQFVENDQLIGTYKKVKR